MTELASGRRSFINALDLTGTAHLMDGLLEADVTVPRQRIAKHKTFTGEALSFN